MKEVGKKTTIPQEITSVVEILEKGGFEAWLVGGCVRDLFLGRDPKDWDITTNAVPEEIISLFPKTFYENSFGTVGIVNETTEDETLKIVEVTPYRLETGYSDLRHPDQVTFSKNLADDLRRRDFTVNAIAINLSKGAIKDISDPYDGIKDIKDRVIRTVLNPNDRFGEDALRIMRAVRLATELGFTINNDTKMAIQSHSDKLKSISAERIRDEFVKILMSKEPKKGLEMLYETGILHIILPEIARSKGVGQNQAHAFDVFEHLLRTLQHSADKNWPLDIRLASLFHDISKPETKDVSHETRQITFYGHDVIGSRVTKKILERMKFPQKMVEKVVKLVRWHMFFSDTQTITLSAVRRMVNNVGKENIWDLINLRLCDRIGTGRPKENPYRLRKYQAMIEEALRDPISVGMLKIDGKKIIDITHETPGPRIGYILHALLEEVLEDPKLNTEKYLVQKTLDLAKLSEKELKKLGEKGKEAKEAVEEENVGEIRKKHYVS